MNKKNIKPLILSSLAALSLGSMSVAGTFALFTDQAETKVEIQAGVVDVDAEISDLAFYELGVTAPITNTDSSGAYVNSIGGTAKINGSTLVLNKWAPGDKVTFKLTVRNKSNVDILTRLRETHSTTSSVDLYEALDITYTKVSGLDADKIFHWNTVGAASNTVSGDTITVLNVTIEFPNHGDLITAREEGIDNHYQNSNCTIVLSQQAVQGNAEAVDLVSQWNNILQGTSSATRKNDSLTAAIEEVGALEAQLKSERIVWNAAEDKFYYEEEVAAADRYKYFKAYDAMPVVQNWSVYATQNWVGTNLDISLKGIGFDVGSKAASIETVSYVGEATARTNRIYTNSASTNITINAPLDTVQHYGVAGILDIQAVAGSSYHEFGKVAFVEISKGRIALEQNSEVAQIHVEKKTESTFDEIIISKHQSVELPTLSRDDVTIPSGGTLVVALQEGTGVITEQTDLDYVWLTKQGIFEQIAVSDNKQSVVSAQQSQPTYADQVQSQDTQSAAQQIANNIGRDNEGKVSQAVTVPGETPTNATIILDENRDLIVVTDVENPAETKMTGTAVEAAVEQKVEEKGLDKDAKKAAAEEQVAIVTIEEDDNYAARIGTHGYATLEAAVAAAQAGDTIVLLKNIALNNQMINVNKSINIDGSGYTITAVNDDVATNKKWYVFYFEDEAGADKVLDCAVRNLTINATGYQEAILMNDNDCELSNKNQLLLDKVNVSTQGGAIYSNGRSVATVKNSTFNRNGEYLAGKAQPYYAAAQVGYGGTINLEGVTINSDHTGIASYPSGGTVNVRNTNITIAAGGDYAAYAWHEQSYDAGTYADWCDSAIINIYSGNINGVLAENLVGHTAGSVRNRVAEVYLYGGTYDRDVAAYCAAGYRAKQVGESSWQVVEMCQNHNFQYTEIDEIHHKKVCTVCGYEETCLHEYEDECNVCTVCGHGSASDPLHHTKNVVTLSHGATSKEYDSVSAAIAAFNKSEADEAHTLTFGPGVYHLPINTYLIEENPAYDLHTLRITGTRAGNEYLSIVKPVYGDYFASVGGTSAVNSGLFCISGLTDYNEGKGGVTVDNLFFDIPAVDDSRARFGAIYCLTGGSGQPSILFPESGTAHRYAHNVLVDNCKFRGPGGKLAYAVAANVNNSQPTCITIQNCEGEMMNCWYNGYAVKGHYTGDFGVKIMNCESSNFLVVANLMSEGSNLYVKNVNGTFVYSEPNAAKSTESWIIQAYKDCTVDVIDCNWTMVGKTNKSAQASFIYGNKANITLDISNSTFTRVSDDPNEIVLARNAINKAGNTIDFSKSDSTIVIA